MVSIDYTNMLAESVGEENGIAEEELHEAASLLHAEHQHLSRWRQEHPGNFFDLPSDEEGAAAIADWAKDAGKRFDDFVVLGIGGSGLGAACLVDALGNPAAKFRAPENACRVHVLDNVDPAQAGALLDALDLSRTCFNVVSKSGSTVETLAQFCIVRRRLESALGEGWKKHVVITTDPRHGPLRELAQREGLSSFPVPANVGGRFSVLSAVGLLPAAAAGIDVGALLEGARAARERCTRESLYENPAYLLATLLLLADHDHEMRSVVMMPYAAGLRRFSDWFVQLWAESLGKRVDVDGDEIFSGQTPIPAVGATDQHSQVQLFVEGPADKVIVFVEVERLGEAMTIPEEHAGSLAPHLAGRDLGDLLGAEKLGTEFALTRAGRPNLTLTIADMSPRSLGGLLFTWETATAFCGFLRSIDPFDQPGVELGKRMAHARLGHADYGAEAAELDGYIARRRHVMKAEA